MPKFDIPVIATVEAKSIHEARQIAYEALAGVRAVDVSMADDSQTDMVNQRIVFLHPEDAHADYDVETYNAELNDSRKKDDDEDEG